MKGGLVKFTFLGVGLFILLFLILFLPNGKSNPDTGITNCTNLTIMGERYNLTNDIYNNQIADACINIFSPNVTFNCNGHYIWSIQNYSGVYVNATKVTINGCNITTGSGGNANASGIYLNSNNATIFNNSIFGGGYAGIYFNHSSNNNLTNNNATNNNFTAGFYLLLSSNNTLTSNYIQNNLSNGIYLNSSNNNLLINNIGKSNLSSGIYLYNSSNNFLNFNTGTSNTNAGIYLTLSLNNTISNSVLNNNLYGLYLSYSNGTTISNISSSLNSYGVYLQNSYGSNLTNITANNNLYGIYLSFFNDSILTNTITNTNSISGLTILNSSNNTFTNIVASYNTVYGIFLQIANNNTFTGTTTNNNTYGLYIRATNSTSLFNGMSGYNSGAGGYLFDVYNITLSNMTSTNNPYGLALEGAIYYNTLKNSIIQYSGIAGVVVNTTGTFPQYNFFYNNYFNDTTTYYNPLNYVNPALLVGFNWSTVKNFFNTTLTLGTNIVHGPYIGGNYWANPNGTGFSQSPQNCTDRGDGICSNSIILDLAGNYDYLPLVCYESWSCEDWGKCSDGIQTRTCRDANLCQTYRFKPTTSQTCFVDFGGHLAQSESGGSGGGSSFTSSITNIAPDKPVKIIINNSQMDLNSLILNVKKEVANSSVNIIKLNQTATNLITGLPIGRLYQAFEIEPGISNADIINATINFRINKTWLADNNITFHQKGNRFWLLENDIVGNIIIYRHPDGANAWIPLTTNYSYQDNQSYHFYAYSKGFSTFAIFLNKYDCLPNSARCDNNEVQLCLGNSTWLVTEHCQYGCGDRKCAGSFFVSEQFRFLSIVIVIAVVVIGLILIFYKKKKK